MEEKRPEQGHFPRGQNMRLNGEQYVFNICLIKFLIYNYSYGFPHRS